ncbi:hypothetical protein [Kitasatospora sp. NPDC088346]|uniref:hypothetical protein n=1 Tax=Kitasatospora sp. NPDC088346 TaxID=3364073 RepID=UPI0038139D8B
MTTTPGGGEWRPFGLDETVTVPNATPDEPLAERTLPLPPPQIPPQPPTAPAAAASTGWTTTMPVLQLPPPLPPTAPGPAPVPGPAGAPEQPGGRAPRGRILVVEGGYGGGRRPWGRGGSGQAPVLSAMLAAVPPQMLLAADGVDAVHLPGASDPQSVLAHLRAASRHPGPLLVHLGGHLVADRRSGQLHLTLRDAKAGESLPWQALAAELRHRPAEWDTLVIADLSADQAAMPQVQSAITPLVDGVPLWAAVSVDPEQIGTFTRALIEALHGGRPGLEAVLTPEQVRQQVHSVLRADVVTVTAHAPDRPIFRNTARQIGGGEPRPYEGPRPAAVMPKPQTRVVRPTARQPEPPVPPRPTPEQARRARVPVSLFKPDVPLTPRRIRPVTLEKTVGDPAAPAVTLAKTAAAAAPPPVVRLDKPSVPADRAAGPAGEQDAERPADAPAVDPVAVYREEIGLIVRFADNGDHATAGGLARDLEERAVAAFGAVAPLVLQVRQVRAHVSRLAGRPAAAADLYREVALTLLRTEGPDHPDTQQAATNAEACWRAIRSPAEAIGVAPDIIELRAHLPGPDGRKLRASERYLRQLVEARAAAEALDEGTAEPASAFGD